MPKFLVVGARLKDGELAELSIYPLDLDDELEAMGHMQMDYVVDAVEVIVGIKKGDSYFASFQDWKEMYPVEIVARNGKETLEVADVGQPAEHKTLRSLPGGS